MTGVLPFIDINGREVANAYRTAAYVQRFGPLTFNAARLGCLILGREVGGTSPFISPALDPAPWYDSTIPESAEFLGFVPRLRFQELIVKRNVTQRFGSVGGGVIGVEQVSAKTIACDGYLIALSCAGMEYGRHWFYSQLGADGQGCSLDTIRLRESCPPDDGSNDTRGERIFYDCALVDGITQSDFGGDTCCDYDGLAFKFASQSPFSYSRAGASLPSTAQEVHASVSGLQTVMNPSVAPPAPPVLDTFVRANAGPPPSASWSGTPMQGFFNFLTVNTNTLRNSSASLGAGAYWNPTTFGADQAVSIVVPARVANAQFSIFGRITNPGQLTGDGAYLRMITGAAGTGLDVCVIGRTGLASQNLLYTLTYGAVGLTFAAGDTYMLTCRGRCLEGWMKPSGGRWVCVAAAYDLIPTIPAASYAGVGIDSNSSIAVALGSWGAGTIAAPAGGLPYPRDVVSIAVPKISSGITSPIVTLKAPNNNKALPTGGTDWSAISSAGIRVQMKKGSALGTAGDCFQSDDFAVDNLATRWSQKQAASWQITGGKLKPVSLGLSGGTTSRGIRRLDSGGILAKYEGGKVQASFKTGATSTAGGAWGVCWNSSLFASSVVGAFVYGSTSPYGYQNTFAINNTTNGGTISDSVAFTLALGTTYFIICELLPLALGYDVRAYLVNGLTGEMLTRPLRGTIGTLNPTGPLFTPAIDAIPVETTEEWDSFYAVDYTDEAAYIEANLPPGTLILDGSRRVAQFTNAQGNSLPVEASSYLSTPPGTPLGWPDLFAGEGPGCLQIWSLTAAYKGTTGQAAMQTRQR